MALGVLLVILAGVIAWQGLRLGEPVYQERALGVWPVQYGTNHWSAGRNGELDMQAELAIRQISTGVQSFKVARAENGSSRSRVGEFGERRAVSGPI